MKITRINQSLTVVLSDNTVLTTNACTDEMYAQVLLNEGNDILMREMLQPNYHTKKAEFDRKWSMLNNIEESEYMTVEGQSLYILKISNLSLPGDLAVAIWNAEQEKNLELLTSYLNFWTLASLNPSAEARTNLFWFLTRYGMSISSSGLFVAYRNVVLKNEGNKISAKWAKFITDSFSYIRHKRRQNPANFFIGKNWDKERICTTSREKLKKVKGNLKELYEQLSDVDSAPVYTDGYTGKFTISIGTPVSMPRNRCDSNQENTCSRGLHVAGKSWLQSNYFGDVGLRVLINPADVVAVPPRDSYGKMRVCAYYPVSIVDFDEEGQIVDEKLEDGFEDNFLDLISYAGTVNNDDSSKYEIQVPVLHTFDRELLMERMEEIKELLRIKNQE
jgi:hypothetical protein